MMAELKPCPFCGGQAELKRWSLPGRSAEQFTVVCTGCGAMTWPYCCGEAWAAEHWNRRTTHDSL